jgi:AmmeMemoRadiSam system protein B/AmmeMemoRadiSam system protein A
MELAMHPVRPAAVAGSFYPGPPAALSSTVQTLLAKAGPGNASSAVPKAIIVPHAGYIYSGATAARAYARLTGARRQIRRVVLLGPVHRVPVRGLALPGVAAFATPLGEIEIDQAAADALADLPQVRVSTAAHAHEHSLEVQLPFLQSVLDDFKLLPLAVGNATPAEVAQVLERLWGGPETLIVISTDLSHFLPYAAAQALDRETSQRIIALDAVLNHEQACGGTPVNGMLLAARRHGLQAELLDLCNSGDTAGDRSRVVGYAAFALAPAQVPAATDDRERGTILLPIARAAIARALGQSVIAAQDAPWLQERGASFVTLTQNGQLRGCIGTLEARRSLLLDVQANAVAAAVRDPRFAALTLAELAQTEIEVSLLSPLQALQFDSQAQALAQLRPGIDGVLFEYQQHRSTFLPQVWEQLPDPLQFMAQLKRKAGLSADFWAEGVRLQRYTVSKWKESDFKKAGP